METAPRAPARASGSARSSAPEPCAPGASTRRTPERSLRASRLSTGWPTTLAGADPGRRRAPVAEKYEGYCVKCKEKREFDGEVTETENGRRMAKGT
ncbi:MAG: DUF5679 domain-containing protein, partial [Frankia sp.]|nr:DUF5679 domain-containing protein [Frankia sp.]